MRRYLAIAAAVLALLAAVKGSPSPLTPGSVDVAALARDIEGEADHVTAIELAQWIKDRKPGLRVLDVRSDSEFKEFAIPTAERVPLTAMAGMRPRADETLVLYSEGGAHAAQGWVLLRASGHGNVFFLRGGLLDWMDDIVSPVISPPSGNAAADSVWARQASLSRYFGGTPRVGATPILPQVDPREATAAAAVSRAKRRGC